MRPNYVLNFSKFRHTVILMWSHSIRLVFKNMSCTWQKPNTLRQLLSYKMIIKRNAISKLIIHLLSSNRAQKKKPYKTWINNFPYQGKMQFSFKSPSKNSSSGFSRAKCILKWSRQIEILKYTGKFKESLLEIIHLSIIFNYSCQKARVFFMIEEKTNWLSKGLVSESGFSTIWPSIKLSGFLFPSQWNNKSEMIILVY